ncbi:MAG: hypothetical protein ACLVL2_13040 [Bacteroides cellulosilyticus]
MITIETWQHSASSTDGATFKEVGGELRLGYQMKTFQGVRYALFAFNTNGKAGGYADFDNFKVKEPLADRSKNLPLGKVITLTNLANGEQVWANPHGMLNRSYHEAIRSTVPDASSVYTTADKDV